MVSLLRIDFFKWEFFISFFSIRHFYTCFFFFKFITLGFHQNYKNWKHLYFFLSRMKISNWKNLWLDFLFSWMCRISSNNFSSFTWIFNLWKIILFSILLLFIWSSIILLDLSLFTSLFLAHHFTPWFFLFLFLFYYYIILYLYFILNYKNLHEINKFFKKNHEMNVNWLNCLEKTIFLK